MTALLDRLWRLLTWWLFPPGWMQTRTWGTQ